MLFKNFFICLSLESPALLHNSIELMLQVLLGGSTRLPPWNPKGMFSLSSLHSQAGLDLCSANWTHLSDFGSSVRDTVTRGWGLQLQVLASPTPPQLLGLSIS